VFQAGDIWRCYVCHTCIQCLFTLI